MLGGIVALPQDALDIPESLIQSNNIVADQMDEPTLAKNDVVAEQTKPCSIKLRRISQIEVSKWQKPKLLDETISGTRSANGNYNLREIRVEINTKVPDPNIRPLSPPPTWILQMKVVRTHK